MAKEIMRRNASDNKYLHRDFHITLNVGIEYLREQYGGDSVREYLMQFALNYYAPLRAALAEKGPDAIREHYARVYAAEEALDDIGFESAGGELVVRIEKCPAVAHIRKCGGEPSPLYIETTNTVMHTVCEGTPVGFELTAYDDATGAAVQRFCKRGSGA